VLPTVDDSKITASLYVACDEKQCVMALVTRRYAAQTVQVVAEPPWSRA
jgi:hypothetical protein